jgi:hypothetical protein
MMESDYLAVAPAGAGGWAFDNKLIAKVRSHDRRRFRNMLLYPTCHARQAPARGEKS